jgi:glycerol-3-phosphate dehydrogenase
MTEKAMENKQCGVFITRSAGVWMITIFVLALITGFCGGLALGANYEAARLQQALEEIPDINSCY